MEEENKCYCSDFNPQCKHCKGKEFNLSEKIDFVNKKYNYEGWIFVEDVKEFIRRLKEHKNYLGVIKITEKELDKLAGEKLSQEKGELE